jgi:predicted kinase
MTRLVVVSGAPGVGKSFITNEIAKRIGGKRLDTDVVRKHLFGSDPSYTNIESQLTYDALTTYALELLLRGESVILDGTFSEHSGRLKAYEMTRELCIPFDMLHITCPDRKEVERRIEKRDGISDADMSIHDDIEENFDDFHLPVIRYDNSRDKQDAERFVERLFG